MMKQDIQDIICLGPLSNVQGICVLVYACVLVCHRHAEEYDFAMCAIINLTKA